ncbi:MAG: oxidoreductase, partial [Solirubrobacterales bacterium]
MAGSVSEHGEGVDSSLLPVGARVMAGTRFGGYAEQVVVPVADVIPLPEPLS